jgi:Ca-activated chloride channel family protein
LNSSSVEWLHPEAFILILPLLAVWLGLALHARSRRRRAAHAFVAAAMQPRILPAESSGRFWAKTIVFGAALIFGLVALARPHFGVYYEDVKARGSDIYIMIDVSRSMLADDVPPSRLERAKADVNSLVNRLNGERVGLIAFAGVPVVKCPLTTDYNFFRLALSELSPRSVPRGGTMIGDAIRKALDVLPKSNEREQAILLITDGDDQNSFAAEAAAVAAERSVTIFTVGLGDAFQGARVPTGTENSKSFVSYKGEQVWSKMDGKLLEEIALKTHGTYVPAGTKAYDLAGLYADHLSKMRSAEGATQKRMRLREQYQWFLAAAVLCLIADLLISMYAPRAVAFAVPVRKPQKSAAPHTPERPIPPPKAEDSAAKAPPPPSKAPALKPAIERALPLIALALVTLSFCSRSVAYAGEEREMVRQGVELYNKNDFDGAKDKFTKASEDAAKAHDIDDDARVAFDLACAYQKKNDAEHAKENYLKSALAHDKTIAASSRFNLGTLASDAAKTLAGEHPENVPPEKRAEVLEKLKESVLSFRACLEIQPDRADARKNIELIRLWTKLYTDKWREIDKRKAREQANLFQYLEFIIESQRALRASALELKADANLDIFFLHRQAQQELLDEIEPLKEKIKTSLKPTAKPDPQGNAQQAGPPAMNAEQEKQIGEAIALLQKWADEAGAKMHEAGNQLDARAPDKAAVAQKDAIKELERIWNAVVPFNLLLAHDIASETAIVSVLKPAGSRNEGSVEPLGKVFDWFDNLNAIKQLSGGDPKQVPGAPVSPSPGVPLVAQPPKLDVNPAEDEELAELQERTVGRTELLKAKAEMELQQVEKQPAPPQAASANPGQPPAPKGPDPEKVKEGLRKAIELAPKAVEHENGALTALRKNDRATATPEAEEAKRILEEILKAQPKDEQQEKKERDEKKEQDKKDQEQQKKDQEKKDQEKKDQEKKDQEKKDQEKKDEQKDKDKDQQKKDQEKKDKEKKDQEQQKKEKNEMSREQAEAILRKVREREQQHRKEKEEQERVMGGTITVDKDW